MKLANKFRRIAIDYAQMFRSENYHDVISKIEEVAVKGELRLVYEEDLNEMDLVILKEVDGFNIEVRYGQRGIGHVVEVYTVYTIRWNHIK